MKEIISIENVTKRFNDKLVLDNISFSLKEGEILGLIGPNGAGKSTLINIISNLVLPNSGTIKINNFNLLENPIDARRIMGIVPQELALLDEASAYDNLEFFGVFYELRGKLLKERIKEALEIVNLWDNRKEKVKKFSGGMKRRLNIAASILHHPKLLIMDEPTVGIDIESRGRIFEYIKKICKENKTTVIYTSHHIDEIEEIASKIYILHKGTEIAFGSKNEIKNLIPNSNKLIIECSNINGRLLFELSELNGVVEITHDNMEITLTTDNTFKIVDCLNIMNNCDSVPIRINNKENKLEDVFLALTGKSLKD